MRPRLRPTVPVTGAAIDDLSLLNRTVLMTFADLKKYKFLYWFGFPALKAVDGATAAPAIKVRTLFQVSMEITLSVICGVYLFSVG